MYAVQALRLGSVVKTSVTTRHEGHPQHWRTAG
jgi:hypothetical protein